MANRIDRRWLAVALAAASFVTVVLESTVGADERTDFENPHLNDVQVVADGRDLYRRRCFICHHRAGGRGPNLFASKVTYEKFLDTVSHGRKGTQMPAFGARMSTDEIALIHAYVRSTDHYE